MKKILSIVLVLALSLGCFSMVSFAETNTTEHLTEVPEGYVGVYTKDDLDYIKLDMSGKYILMNDIVFEDSDFEKGGDFYNSGKGWDPIGTSSTPFTGTFDGNGYTIKNLYINDTKSYIGLFGYASGATIKNLILDKAEITGGNYTGGVVGYIKKGTVTKCDFNGDIVGGDYTGGCVGYSYSVTTVSHCNVQGTITGGNYVGGIVGYQTTPSSGTTVYNNILYCNNAANIVAKSKVGGIVGYSKSTFEHSLYVQDSSGLAYVEYCSNSGSVSATESRAGGIIGISTGTTYNYSSTSTTYAKNYINYCYNCGDITAPNYAGGLVGGSGDNYTVAKHCYSVGNVNAESNFGGCFDNTPSSVTFCYYLDEAVVNPTCTSGTPKSEDQLRRATAFEQWDFKKVWTMNGREDYAYPELIDVPLVLPEDYIHQHEYTSEITTPATHLADGEKTFTCECGDTYTETIAKIIEHSYTSEITTQPTHLAEGVKTFTCACGDSYTEAIEKIAEHSYTSEVTKEATHKEEGVETFTCECGDTYTKPVAKIPHSYNKAVTAPTCTEKGYTTYTCACGDSYVDNYVNANGHKDENGDYKCDYDCGYEYEKPADPVTPDEPKEETKDNFFTRLLDLIKSFFDLIMSWFKK